MTKSKETALAKAPGTGFFTLADTNLGNMLSGELAGLDLSFERIKIPAAGSTVFEVPGEDGEPDTVKEFSAVILHHHTLNAYYKTKYTGGNSPPDCGSLDGVYGEGDPGGECNRCPLNQYGAATDGKGKACKNRRRIYVLREGEVFPLLLSLPTGSLKEFTRYLKRLLSKGKKSNSVVTRFSLQKAANQGGVVYSRARFAVDRALTPEEQRLLDALTKEIKVYSNRVPFAADGLSGTDAAVDIDMETGEIIDTLGKQ